MSLMSKKEAIQKMGCLDKKCEFLDIHGIYSFCTVLRTDNFCKNKERLIEKDVYNRKTIK